MSSPCRVSTAYDVMVLGKGVAPTVDTAMAAVEQGYADGLTDEFINPTVLGGAPPLCPPPAPPTNPPMHTPHPLRWAMSSSSTQVTVALCGPDYAGMVDGDGILMCNFRADRAREILTALADPALPAELGVGTDRPAKINFADICGLVKYSDGEPSAGSSASCAPSTAVHARAIGGVQRSRPLAWLCMLEVA